MADLENMVDLRLLQIICEAVARVVGISCVVMRNGQRLVRPSNRSLLCAGRHGESYNPNPTCFREYYGGGGKYQYCKHSDMGIELPDRSIRIRTPVRSASKNPNESGYWEIYQCHAGLVDLSVPIHDSDGRILAHFMGGQVLLSETQLDGVREKIRTRYHLEPELDLDDLLQSFRINRVRGLNDLVAVSELLSAIAQTILEIYKEKDARSKIEFDYGNISRILARSVGLCFSRRLSPSLRLPSRLYMLDRETNRFGWRDMNTIHAPNPMYISPKDCVGFKQIQRDWTEAENDQVHECLWRVFRNRKSFWATPRQGYIRKALGCYIPIMGVEGIVQGILQIDFRNFENLKNDEWLVEASLNADTVLRKIARQGSSIIARCLENREGIDILTSEIETQTWLAKAYRNVLTIRQAMDLAGEHRNMPLFWYLMLLSLTHHEGFAFNRAAIYILLQSKLDARCRDGLILRDVYAIGNKTIQDWADCVKKVDPIVDIIEKLSQDSQVRMGSASVEHATQIQAANFNEKPRKFSLFFNDSLFDRVDYGVYKLQWARPTRKLAHEFDRKINRREKVEYPFKYDYFYSTNPDKFKPARGPNYRIELVHKRNVPDGIEYSVLYLDDVWSIYPSYESVRAERLKVLGDSVLIERFLDQTRQMLRNMDLSRRNEFKAMHGITGLAMDAYQYWQELAREAAMDLKKDTRCLIVDAYLNITSHMSPFKSSAKPEPDEPVDLNDLLIRLSYMLSVPGRCLDLPPAPIVDMVKPALVENILIELIYNSKRHGRGVTALSLVEGAPGSKIKWRIQIVNRGAIPEKIIEAAKSDEPTRERSDGHGMSLAAVCDWRKQCRLEFDIRNQVDPADDEKYVVASIWKSLEDKQEG